MRNTKCVIKKVAKWLKMPKIRKEMQSGLKSVPLALGVYRKHLNPLMKKVIQSALKSVPIASVVYLKHPNPLILIVMQSGLKSVPLASLVNRSIQIL